MGRGLAVDYARPVAAWTGPVNTFDPARAPLRDGEPDYNIHPYHPRGTWRRALLFLSLGYRPSAEDLAALAEWNTLDKFQRKAILERDRDRRATTISAAREALEPGEVLGAYALGQRIGGAPGVPHAKAAATILRALPGVAEGRGAGMGLVRRHITGPGGPPGHFLARAPSDFAPFIDQRRANYVRLGKRIGHMTSPARQRDEHGRYRAAS